MEIANFLYKKNEIFFSFKIEFDLLLHDYFPVDDKSILLDENQRWEKKIFLLQFIPRNTAFNWWLIGDTREFQQRLENNISKIDEIEIQFKTLIVQLYIFLHHEWVKLRLLSFNSHPISMTFFFINYVQFHALIVSTM